MPNNLLNSCECCWRKLYLPNNSYRDLSSVRENSRMVNGVWEIPPMRLERDLPSAPGHSNLMSSQSSEFVIDERWCCWTETRGPAGKAELCGSLSPLLGTASGMSCRRGYCWIISVMGRLSCAIQCQRALLVLLSKSGNSSRLLAFRRCSCTCLVLFWAPLTHYIWHYYCFTLPFRHLTGNSVFRNSIHIFFLRPDKETSISWVYH